MREASATVAGLAALCLITVAAPPAAQVAQMELDAILHDMTPQQIAHRRSMCAMGQAPKSAADARAAGIESPDASLWCVAVLTRQGRDGTLGYLRDPSSDRTTPALVFDSGFVGGYLKHDALPPGAPSMATLLPVAERCLEQREPNDKLCSASGYMIGLRAAAGETVKFR